jgi:cell wall-associated NlpC family hydrolase
MEFYRARTGPANLGQIEQMSYGQRYKIESSNMILSIDGFVYNESEADCSDVEPSLVVRNRRLYWAVPDSYAANAPLVNRPYIHGVFDCFTALRDHYKSTYGIVLSAPEYEDGWWLNGKDLYMKNFAAQGFELKTGPMQAGDILAFAVGSQVVNHNAVWLSDDSVYQHVGHCSSIIGPLSPGFKRRLDSVWRHRDLA